MKTLNNKIVNTLIDTIETKIDDNWQNQHQNDKTTEPREVPKFKFDISEKKGQLLAYLTNNSGYFYSKQEK